MIDGERFPDGYTPMAIKNGIYPRDYYPNTERLGPNEMRVTALGTGMPNLITGTTAAYRKAEREPPSVAADWISDDINAGKWDGYRPPPLPEQ
jgi:hypothetical protein